MSEPAYGVLRGTLMLSCALLLCAVLILLRIGGVTVHTYTYELYLCALELVRSPVAMLLTAFVAVVGIEERLSP